MKKIGTIIGKFPLITFFIALGILFAVIYVSSELRTQEQSDTNAQETTSRSVEVFDVDEKITIEVLGEVDRADTITLVATSNGIIQRIAPEGNFVYRGGQVARVADTYSGTSAAGISAEIAQRTKEHQEEVYDDQKTILDIQKDELNKTDQAEVRIARKQITLQEQANEFNRDIAQLQASQANAAVALQNTAAPFTGRVESTFVSVGDSVSVGMPLAVLRADEVHDAQIVAYMGAVRASHISMSSEAHAQVGGDTYPLRIVNIAKAPTAAGAYAVTFAQVGGNGEEGKEIFPDGTYINIIIPLEDNDILAPLDAIRYGIDGPEVYIVSEGKAQVQSVVLGDALGSHVIIESGITDRDMIILDRSVTNGEEVTVQQQGEVQEKVGIEESPVIDLAQ